MSIRTPRAFSSQVRAISNFGELNPWVAQVNDTLYDSVNSLNDIAIMLRRITNTTSPSSLLAPHGGNHLPSGSDPLATAAPTFTFGTAAAVGVANALVRSDATLAMFDTTAPADLAATAAVGAIAFSARRDHVHRHPFALMEYTNSKKLTLTSTTTIATLTCDVAQLRIAGLTTGFNPAVTNACHFGTTGLRWLSVRVGTTGIDCTGPLMMGATRGVASNFDPDGDNLYNCGGSLGSWAGVFTWALALKDASGNDTTVAAVSSPALSAPRVFTLNVANADRTLNLTGDATLADWFDQNVKVAGTPQHARLGVGQAADGTVLFALNDAVTAPSTSAIAALTNKYGGDTNYLGDPAIWVRMRVGGSTYKFAGYNV